MKYPIMLATPEFQQEFLECIKPSIEDFPRPLLGQYTRSRGGVLIHIAVLLYMFVGLAVVCEDYFVPSLGRIADGNFCIIDGNVGGEDGQ